MTRRTLLALAGGIDAYAQLVAPRDRQNAAHFAVG